MRHVAIALTLCVLAAHRAPAQTGEASPDRIVADLTSRNEATVIAALRRAEQLAKAHGDGPADDADLARVNTAIVNLAATADRNTLWRIALYLQAQGDATAPPFTELPIANACLRLLQPSGHHLDIRNAAAAASAAWKLGITLGPNQQAVATSLAAIAENPRTHRRKRAPAINALIHAPGPQADSILIRIATRDADRHHRAAAITALGERARWSQFNQPPQTTINALAQAAKDHEPAVVSTAADATRRLFDYGITDNQRRRIATAMLANTSVPDRAVSTIAHSIAQIATGLEDLIPRYQTYLATTARPHLEPGDADRYLAIIRGRALSP
ncbi:MAG: hypothetical protein AAFZ67_13995 [Planctomycetota bacterium]